MFGWQFWWIARHHISTLKKLFFWKVRYYATCLANRPPTWEMNTCSRVFQESRIAIVFHGSRDFKGIRRWSFAKLLSSFVTPMEHDKLHAITTLASWIWSGFFTPKREMGQSLPLLCSAINYTPLYCHPKWTSLSPLFESFLCSACGRASFGIKLSEIKVVEIKRCFIH